jgi:hypothetical protein
MKDSVKLIINKVTLKKCETKESQNKLQQAQWSKKKEKDYPKGRKMR